LGHSRPTFLTRDSDEVLLHSCPLTYSGNRDCLVSGIHIQSIEFQNDSQEFEVGQTHETLPAATTERNSEWQEIMLISTSTSADPVLPGVRIETNTTGLGSRNLYFGTDNECLRTVDISIVQALIQNCKYLENGYVIVPPEKQTEWTTWYTAWTGIGHWYLCGKTVTIEELEPHEYTHDDESDTNRLLELGWPVFTDEHVLIGKYKVGLSLMHAGGPSGSDDVYVRTSNKLDPYIEFLVVRSKFLRYGEEDGMRSCPCKKRYTFFISEQYKLNDLLPLASLVAETKSTGVASYSDKCGHGMNISCQLYSMTVLHWV
jgi:hypothetical protein